MPLTNMDSPLPAFLIALPLVSALVVLGVGRWPQLAAGIGAVATAGVAGLALVAGRGSGPVVASWVVAGRSFELTPFVAQFLAVLAIGLAVLLALQPVRPGLSGPAAGGLAALAFLAAALMIQPFAFGAIFLVAATACVVPALYGGRFAAAMPSWRTFLAVALSMPLLIAAGWLLDSGQSQTAGVEIALLLASLLLLGGFPFYVWLSGVARHASPAAIALALGIVGAGAAVWLTQVLDQFPAVRGSTVFQTAVIGSVLLTPLIAAFGLSRAVDWRDWLAYGLVLDAGLHVATLMVPGSGATAVMAVGTIGRLLALLLVVAVIDVGDSTAQRRDGQASNRSRLILAFAGMALVGLPLTPAFAARWETLQALAGSSPLVLGLVLAAMVAASMAMLRFSMQAGPSIVSIERSRGAKVAAALLLIIALFMGLIGPLLIDYWMKLIVG